MDIHEHKPMLGELSTQICDQIAEHEQRNIELARKNYPGAWVECRQKMLGILHLLQSYKSGIPGKTSAAIAEKIVLIASYTQGVIATERLISSGQYIKAAAVLKQELEVVVRLEEVKAGVARIGKTPNMKYAPEGGKRVYGMLNNIAHPSRLDHLQDLIAKYTGGAINGVGVVPVYIPQIARTLFSHHVSLLRDISYHQIILAAEMYDPSDPEIQASADEHEWVQEMFPGE
jgi:hypothetical protein